MEPFAKAANLKIDTRFGNDQSADLAADLRANQQGKVILICWRHPYMPALLSALGANPETFLPNGKWPGAVFDWIIVLSFDQDGHLIPSSSTRTNEHLLPSDSQELGEFARSLSWGAHMDCKALTGARGNGELSHLLQIAFHPRGMLGH